ncbi:cytochrome P450 monooxygenase-like protein, partial [Dinothrombium tinctorium]
MIFGVLIITTSIAAVFVLWHRLTFWKRQGIVNEVASIYNRFTKPFHIADQIAYKKYGSVVGTYEGLRPCLMVTDTTLIKKILIEEFYKFPNHRIFYNEKQLAGKSLLALENKNWKRVRRILTPLFSTANLKKMKPLIEECVSTLNKNLEFAAKRNIPINVKDYFSAFAIDVISSSVFGVKIDSINNPQHAIVKNLRKFLGRHISLKSILVFWWPSLMKSLDLYLFDYKILVFLNDFITQLIKRRQQEQNVETNRKDFIQLLMDAKLDNDDIEETKR